MPASRNIFLIGPMGSGKTAVGKQIARLLKFPFIDSDREIETRTGADIPLIFEREGEAGFRKREREAITELTARSGVVLATGGGGVVYLETSVAQQAERAGRSSHRPLLTGADPRRRLEELMRIREPLYREIADFIATTTRRRVNPVAERIVLAYRASTAQP